MRLRIDRAEVRADDGGALVVDWAESEALVTWSVTNRGDRPVTAAAVALVARIDPVAEPLRMLSNGYQSWSPTGVATFRVDEHPSRREGMHHLALTTLHSDDSVADPHELRSDLVTGLLDDAGRGLVTGFLGGSEHDGLFRLRPAADGSDAVELWIEAHLGGARLDGGEVRHLHDVWHQETELDISVALEEWAAAFGDAAGALTAAPYQVGWCSWYHYFHRVTEADLRANLAAAAHWPFDVFQLDDGYQPAIGDWLTTNDRFPTDLSGLAAAIAAEGRVPGLWLAPFVASPESAVARAHPEWFATHLPSGRPLVGVVNPIWGPPVSTLDTTNPEVLDHLTETAAALVEAGFPYLKLDFTFAPSIPGGYADPGRTPAQRVRAGFEAIRRGAGPDAFLLGCGAPLAPAVGLVDGMRIGPDVAPAWHPPALEAVPSKHPESAPATVNAWRSTLVRSFMHRRLWLNDPDCLMLRTDQTEMTEEQVRAWALAVGVSGGMALVSDDLGLLDRAARALLDEVIELGRASDRAAAAGEPPRCGDLMEANPPRRLAGGATELVGDPDRGDAYVQGLLA